TKLAKQCFSIDVFDLASFLQCNAAIDFVEPGFFNLRRAMSHTPRKLVREMNAISFRQLHDFFAHFFECSRHSEILPRLHRLAQFLGLEMAEERLEEDIE